MRRVWLTAALVAVLVGGSVIRPPSTAASSSCRCMADGTCPLAGARQHASCAHGHHSGHSGPGSSCPVMAQSCEHRLPVLLPMTRSEPPPAVLRLVSPAWAGAIEAALPLPSLGERQTPDPPPPRSSFPV